ncbi:MAG: hypothetical protein QXV69_03030 [Sulfolobaceae archaeon]
MSEPVFKMEFEGKAKIGEIFSGFKAIQLRPEDLSSPISFQMALSRIYQELMNAFSQPPRKHYVAEVKFTDSLGNPIVLGVDLGEKVPPLSKKEVKVRIVVEFYDEE